MSSSAACTFLFWWSGLEFRLKTLEDDEMRDFADILKLCRNSNPIQIDAQPAHLLARECDCRLGEFVSDLNEIIPGIALKSPARALV
ncbi:MAG: hypothetical protein ACJ8DM_12465, partial [Microvirga sp.]